MELRNIFYPADFKDRFLIPDRDNFIHTRFYVNDYRNIPHSYLTLLNSRKKELAKIFLDSSITYLDITFRITGKDYGPLYFRELGSDPVAYIIKDTDLRNGYAFEGDLCHDKELRSVLANDYLSVKIDRFQGAKVNSIFCSAFENPFFSFFPLYSKAEKVSFPFTDFSVSGKDVPGFDNFKFKLSFPSDNQLNFELKKKGFIVRKHFSFFKGSPILCSVLETSVYTKKKPKVIPGFRTVLNFGLTPHNRYFTPGSAGIYEELYYPEITRYWSELKYNNLSVLQFAFVDAVTEEVFVQIFKPNKPGELVVGHNDNCISVSGYGDDVELGDGRKVISKLYTCLLYTSPSPRDRTRSRMPSSA